MCSNGMGLILISSHNSQSKETYWGTHIITELVGRPWNYTAVNVDSVCFNFISNNRTAVNKFAPVSKSNSSKISWINTM